MTELCFSKQSQVLGLYEALRAEGITDDQLNLGYHLIDYSKPGPNETLQGVGGCLEEPEIIENALDLFNRDPTNTALRKILEGFMQREISWVIDDPAINRKISFAISLLDQILKKQGFNPATDEYKEKMAVGLFYFVDFPDDQKIIRGRLDILVERTRELEEVGLRRFRHFLVRNGGLGTSLMEEDAPEEATATEALRMKKGWCTERSKILYAVYRAASLDPSFVMVPEAVLRRLAREKGQKLPDPQLYARSAGTHG